MLTFAMVRSQTAKWSTLCSHLPEEHLDYAMLKRVGFALRSHYVLGMETVHNNAAVRS